MQAHIVNNYINKVQIRQLKLLIMINKQIKKDQTDNQMDKINSHKLVIVPI